MAIIREAMRRDISVTDTGARRILRLSKNHQHEFIVGTITSKTSHIAVALSDDKHATKTVLSAAGLPVLKSRRVLSSDEAVAAWKIIGKPVVIKPNSGSSGRAVEVNLDSEVDIRKAFSHARKISRTVLVENYHYGRDYRLLVIDRVVVGIVEKYPAFVVGDGSSNIATLIDRLNNDAKRGTGCERPMAKVDLDDVLRTYLNRQGFFLQSVPLNGQRIILNGLGSVSRGAVTIDRTNGAHKEICDLAVQATGVIGLDIAGVDIVASDISMPASYSKPFILEVNCSPGFRAHLVPSAGEPRFPDHALLDYLFPCSSRASLHVIPVPVS
ncbi:Cyanophycin synthase [Asaia bogorensis]|uniref:Cyanophycin synthase n=2 Tax=Acetobacteraceae TaxID=433 RepID=A0A060QJD2_9PROT|nr:Cyanophycin synthase [Asaia bogorensis]